MFIIINNNDQREKCELHTHKNIVSSLFIKKPFDHIITIICNIYIFTFKYLLKVYSINYTLCYV